MARGYIEYISPVVDDFDVNTTDNITEARVANITPCFTIMVN